MKNVIYHNLRCSKSRLALGILRDRDIDIDVVEYLKEPPSIKELKSICEKLQLKPFEIIRTQEALFAELGLSLNDKKSDKEWLQILHEHPQLIERPIIVVQGRAVIGRPPENVFSIIEP